MQYGLVHETGEVDYDQVEALALEHKPKMIIAGFSAYSGIMDWARFREIADKVEECDPEFQTISPRVESFSHRKVLGDNGPSIQITAILCLIFVVFDMILPVTGSWFHKISAYPREFGPLSFSVLFNFALTLYVLNTYAKGFLKRSYKNYIENSSMDMETLISLGCTSAFILSLSESRVD